METSLMRHALLSLTDIMPYEVNMIKRAIWDYGIRRRNDMLHGGNLAFLAGFSLDNVCYVFVIKCLGEKGD